MYAFKIQDDEEQKKAKGVPKHIVKNEINFNMYKKTLEEHCNERVNFNSIRSYQHQFYSITCNKIGLSDYENTIYYSSNQVSYPHGNWRTNQ